MKKGEIQFLLVRTQAGKWTFPKGGVNGDRTYADAAAREAREEAGVYGRVEAHHFVRFCYPKPPVSNGRTQEVVVAAHLCRVVDLHEPQEDYRQPTWFPTAKAKRRLAQHRERKYAKEFARVVDLAQRRILRKLS